MNRRCARRSGSGGRKRGAKRRAGPPHPDIGGRLALRRASGSLPGSGIRSRIGAAEGCGSGLRADGLLAGLPQATKSASHENGRLRIRASHSPYL